MDRSDRPENFLSRWSRRKLAAAREPALPGSQAPAPAAPAQGVVAAAEAAPATSATTPGAASTTAAPALPAVETLTFESDFTAFLQPGVEPTVQRAALRKLLHDPRFNQMDGLDVYIDDYSKPSPLDPAIARMLADAQNMFLPRVEPADDQAAQADGTAGAGSADNERRDLGARNGAPLPSTSAATTAEAPAATAPVVAERSPPVGDATFDHHEPHAQGDA